MKELQKIVNDKVSEMATSGDIQKSIEDGVKSAINKAIEKQFESWGNITKQLEKAFDENLKVDESKINIPCFTAVMTEVVNSNINEFFKGQAADKLHKLMKDKLSPLPDEMSLVEFVDMICKEWYVDDYDSFGDVDDYATVEFEESRHGWYDLKIWSKKPGSGYSDKKVQLTISKEGNLRGRHGSTDPYYVFDVDALIFKAYAQGIKFTGIQDFNEDDCELSLKPCCD